MYSKHQLVCSPGLGEYDGLGKFRIGKVFRKAAKKLNPVRIVKRAIKSTRKRIKNPKMILKDIRRQTLRVATLGASDFYEKNVKRRRKKYKTRSRKTVNRMKANGATQGEIDAYLYRRRSKLKHRRKKVQRQAKVGAAVTALIVANIATGGALTSPIMSGLKTLGPGALKFGAKTLLPMAAQQMMGGGGGQQGPGGGYGMPGADGQYPGGGYYGGTGQPGQYTGPGAGLVGGYQQTMQQAGINPIVPIALLGAGLAVFLVLR